MRIKRRSLSPDLHNLAKSVRLSRTMRNSPTEILGQLVTDQRANWGMGDRLGDSIADAIGLDDTEEHLLVSLDDLGENLVEARIT